MIPFLVLICILPGCEEYQPGSGVRWQEIVDIPMPPRIGAASFMINSTIYMGFGADGNSRFQDWWSYDVDQKEWTQLNDFPYGTRIGLLSFAVDGRGFICFGYDSGNNPLTQFWEYIPSTDGWLFRGYFPSGPRTQPIAMVIGDKAYVGGGVYNDEYKTDFYSYDRRRDLWTNRRSIPINATQAMTTFTSNGEGHIIGGVGATSFENDHYSYNPGTNEWTELTPFPGMDRFNASGFSFEPFSFIGFGSISNNEWVDDLWSWDPDRGRWRERFHHFKGKGRNLPVSGSNGIVGYYGFGSNRGLLNDFYILHPSK